MKCYSCKKEVKPHKAWYYKSKQWHWDCLSEKAKEYFQKKLAKANKE